MGGYRGMSERDSPLVRRSTDRVFDRSKLRSFVEVAPLPAEHAAAPRCRRGPIPVLEQSDAGVARAPLCDAASGG
jgi:hypothetical protein